MVSSDTCLMECIDDSLHGQVQLVTSMRMAEFKNLEGQVALAALNQREEDILNQIAGDAEEKEVGQVSWNQVDAFRLETPVVRRDGEPFQVWYE